VAICGTARRIPVGPQLVRAAAVILATALAGGVAATGAVAANEPDTRLTACLAETDTAFAATRTLDLDGRWAALDRFSAGESRCLATIAATCSQRLRTLDARSGCFDDLLASTTRLRQTALAALPAPDDVPAALRDRFTRWQDSLDRANPAAGCPFRDGHPPSACDALSAGQAMIAARDWARMFEVLDDAG
jgi:hypothetical protein